MRFPILAVLLPLVAAGCQSAGAGRPVAGSEPATVAPAMRSPGSPQKRINPVIAASRAASKSNSNRSPDGEDASASGKSAVRLASDEQVVSETPVVTDEKIATTTDSATSPVDGMNLDLAIETGLAQNPDLIAQRQAEGVSVAALGVAETYPFNPFVQVQATPLQDQRFGNGPGTVYHYVLLMQTIQLAHQQCFREEGAHASLNSVRWTVHQAELLNLVQTERLYLTALYQRGIRNITRQNADSNQQLLAVLEKQLEAGQAAAADVAIVRLDTRSTRQQALLAEANYQTALLDLRRQLNIPASVPLDLPEDLQQWEWLPADAVRLVAFQNHTASPIEYANADHVVSTLVASRPDVMAALSDVDVARANQRLACASRVPDLQIGPYYQRTADGTTFLGFRAQMDIPVFNNGNPLVRQRTCELHQRATVWQQLQRRAELEGSAAIARYERARNFVAETQTEVSESLPSELQALEEQFRAGEVDVLRVFQARLSLVQNRRAYLDTLNELAQAAVGVTAATGVPPQALISMRPAATP